MVVSHDRPAGVRLGVAVRARNALDALEHLVGGLGTALLALLTTLWLALTAAACLVGVGLRLLPSALHAVRAVADRERGRLSRWGPKIVGPAPPPDGLRAMLGDRAVRREVRWVVTHALLGLFLGLVGATLPLSAAHDVTFPLYWRALPESESASAVGWWTVHDWPGAMAVSGVGVALVGVVVLCAPALARLQAWPGRRLLSPGPGTDLVLRVAELTATRAAALDAHVTELRRVERALHDGTQNRIVAVTVLLGAARRALARDPQEAAAVLDRAQDAAEQALTELRAVVRSILPPVLADRSLPDALTALAAGCPVPCRVDADMPGRCPAAVEATAYFAVAEALTNIARHSGAGEARVAVRAAGWTAARGGPRRRPRRRRRARRHRPHRHPSPRRGPRRNTGAGQPSRRPHHAEGDPAMRIVIAEDDALLREGLALLLRAESLDVVATVADPAAFLDAVDAERPDVAIVDVRMPPTHTDEGITAAVAARRRLPGLAVLVLSAYVEQAFATDLLAQGSARLGYLLKERVGRVEEFLEALHRVADGGTAIDPEVVAQLLTRSRPDTRLERLSPRERDVLALMAEGLGNGAIAERLVVSDGAVHKHIRNIFAKLDLPPTDRTDRRVAAVLHFLENA